MKHRKENSMKYIDAEKLKSEIERRIAAYQKNFDKVDNKVAKLSTDGRIASLKEILPFITSLQQEQSEENKLPNKRTRVNYAICKLQSFKPLREAIVLDDYVYDEDKCYRENLLNYIHSIPENRLTEIRSYLKEKGWWPYNDDTDWMEQEQPSTSSNLDEAAEETSQSAYSEPTAAGFAKRSFFKRGFKAGAEWMAKQGVNIHGRVLPGTHGNSYLCERRQK